MDEPSYQKNRWNVGCSIKSDLVDDIETSLSTVSTVPIQKTLDVVNND